MIEWQDNSAHFMTEDVEELRPLANRPVYSILNEQDTNLLVFPLSFEECKDNISHQHIFDLEHCHNGHIVRTGNLAGFIGTEKIQISIHSRFSKQKANEDFFLHYMLQKVLSVNVLDLQHTTTEEKIFDFLLYLFPYYLNKALSQGLYKEYQWNEHNNCNVRGTIDIGKHIKSNMPFNGCVAYRTREFCYDNSITQLIRHTIEYIRTKRNGSTLLHKDADTRANVSQIIFATSKYRKQDRLQIIQKNLKLVCHPYFTLYTPLQKLCLKILHHEQLKYGQKTEKIYGILFDVSWLWEEYLATILVKLSFKHPNNRQKTNGIWLGYRSEDNITHNAFLRYPDFYDKKENGIIIDAKYKNKIDDIADVNQIITYLYRLKGRLGFLIQPTIEICTNTAFSLRGYGADSHAQLIKYHFQVPSNPIDYKSFSKGMDFSEFLLKKVIGEYTM